MQIILSKVVKMDLEEDEMEQEQEMDDLFSGDDLYDTSKEDNNPSYIPEKKKRKKVPPFHFTDRQEAN